MQGAIYNFAASFFFEIGMLFTEIRHLKQFPLLCRQRNGGNRAWGWIVLGCKRLYQIRNVFAFSRYSNRFEPVAQILNRQSVVFDGILTLQKSISYFSVDIIHCNVGLTMKNCSTYWRTYKPQSVRLVCCGTSTLLAGKLRFVKMRSVDSLTFILYSHAR